MASAGYAVTYTVIDNATKQIEAINKRIMMLRAPVERVAKASQKMIDSAGLKKIADGFGWIVRGVTRATAALAEFIPAIGILVGAGTIAGLNKLIGTFAAWGNQLRTNADQIGISAQELQVWQDATERAGGSAVDMTNALKNLHQISVDAFTGKNQDAAAYFRRFHIDLQKANGQLKSSTELLPEVFRVLDSLSDPADRSRVAANLLGDADARLYEEYKRSGQPLDEWIAKEREHQKLTDAQLESLGRYDRAQSSLGVTFKELGRQISATMADHFSPLLEWFDNFVQKHTPDIISALNSLDAQFADLFGDVQAWLDKPENWQKITDTLREVGREIDGIIKDLKWLKDLNDKLRFDPYKAGQESRDFLLNRDPFVAPGQEAPSVGTGPRPQNLPWWAQPGFGLFHRSSYEAPAAPITLQGSTLQRGAGIRDRLASDLGLTPAQASGVVGNLQAESGLQAVNENNPIGGGPGGFGWAQWTGPRRNEFEAWAKAQGLDPKSDQANYGFLLHELRSPEYAGVLANLKAAKTSGEAAAVIESQYEKPAVSNIGTRAAYAGQIEAAGPPAAPPPTQVAGSVDVNITHKNAPPDATVTAQGKGAVTVAPLKVEHPQVDFGAAA
jgi:hypothetical protein